MPIKLHNLSSSKGKTKKRIGRGGKRGTYSGRGLKGQRSRSGGKAGLKRLGLKPLMTQTHKLRGQKSIHLKPEIVNISTINKYYEDGETVSPKTLRAKKIIKTTQHGVKILGGGKLSKKVKLEDCAVSANAANQLKAEKAEKAEKKIFK